MASGEIESLVQRVNALEAHRDAQLEKIKNLGAIQTAHDLELKELRDRFDNGGLEADRV
jgi:hypothetical protein